MCVCVFLYLVIYLEDLTSFIMKSIFSSLISLICTLYNRKETSDGFLCGKLFMRKEHALVSALNISTERKFIYSDQIEGYI